MNKQRTIERFAQLADFNRRMSKNPQAVIELNNQTVEREMTRKIISDILAEYNSFVSPGELYREARIAGYTGQQRELLTIADEMAKEKMVPSRKRGMMQNNWYILPNQEN